MDNIRDSWEWEEVERKLREELYYIFENRDDYYQLNIIVERQQCGPAGDWDGESISIEDCSAPREYPHSVISRIDRGGASSPTVSYYALARAIANYLVDELLPGGTIEESSQPGYSPFYVLITLPPNNPNFAKPSKNRSWWPWRR